MPEGDSVYVLARRLDVLAGRLLSRGELRVPQHATDDLAGRTVLEQDTHGKHLLTRLSGDLTLHTHLRMDGSWSVVRPRRGPPRNLLPDVRVLLATESGPTAYGLLIPVVELLSTAQEHSTIGHLGPDPLRADWEPTEAVHRLAASPRLPISAALLDQRNLAGLGNLWVNELCFLRGVSPWTPVGDVDLPAMVRLAARALRHSALTPGAFQVTTGDSRRGRDHWVSGRFAQPCRRCGTLIEMLGEVPNDPDRRRTWWCPHCQPGPAPTYQKVLDGPPMAMTSAATRLAAVTVAAAVAVIGGTSVAHADTTSWSDPKPNITKVKVKHSGATIKITTTTGVVRSGTYLTIYLDTDADDPGPEFRTDLIPASELMPLMRIEKFGQEGTAVTCDGLRGRADVYGPKTMSLSVPRSCVGNPDKVRVSVRGYFDVKGPNVVDWVPGKKKFTGWVQR